LRLRLRSTLLGCAPFAGAALYAWHCDRDGGYSLYSPAVAGENYLRAVGVADADGVVRFTTVFPGAYPGRYPHVHFEVFSSVAQATGSGSPMATSQLAFPEATCRAVYATPGYESSKRSFPLTPLSRDGVFRDGVSRQMTTIAGTVAKGLTAALTIDV
jgi:protocatechuate 3,4-dioxygenase beta subunit